MTSQMSPLNIIITTYSLASVWADNWHRYWSVRCMCACMCVCVCVCVREGYMHKHMDDGQMGVHTHTHTYTSHHPLYMRVHTCSERQFLEWLIWPQYINTCRNHAERKIVEILHHVAHACLHVQTYTYTHRLPIHFFLGETETDRCSNKTVIRERMCWRLSRFNKLFCG